MKDFFMEKLFKVINDFKIELTDSLTTYHIEILQQMGIKKLRNNLLELFTIPEIACILEQDKKDKITKKEIGNRLKELEDEKEKLQEKLQSIDNNLMLIKVGKKLNLDFDYDVPSVKEQILFSIILG